MRPAPMELPHPKTEVIPTWTRPGDDVFVATESGSIAVREDEPGASGRGLRLGTWIVGGIALFFTGFALTLALQLDAAAVVGDPADDEPVLTRPEVTRASSVELDGETRRTNTVATANRATGARDETPAAAPSERVREHPNGRVRDRVQLDELGRPHGEYTSFHPGGAAWETGRFEHGAKTGTWRAFHENGQLRDESEFVSGRAEGVARLWDAEGHLLRETTMHGQAEGSASSWYASGQLESQGSYTNGRREGPWRFWSPDGTPDEARSGIYATDRKIDG